MTQRLTRLESRIGTRFALYRRMAAHAGIPSDATATPENEKIIRAALLACAACHDTACCNAWLDAGHPGVPVFCRARVALDQLAEASAPATGATRHA